MIFSGLFQKLKHENRKLSAKEREQVVAFLVKPDSILDPQAHSAIYVLCLSSEPTANNIALVERFLANTVDDYVRAAAIAGIFTIWDVLNEPYVTYLLGSLERILDEERVESSMTALDAGLHLMHAHARYDLSVAINRAVDVLFDAVQLENAVEGEEGFAANMLISACLKLRNVGARRAGQRLTHFNTLDEALEVYRNKRAYLLAPLH